MTRQNLNGRRRIATAGSSFLLNRDCFSLRRRCKCSAFALREPMNVPSFRSKLRLRGGGGGGGPRLITRLVLKYNILVSRRVPVAPFEKKRLRPIRGMCGDARCMTRLGACVETKGYGAEKRERDYRVSEPIRCIPNCIQRCSSSDWSTI